MLDYKPDDDTPLHSLFSSPPVVWYLQYLVHRIAV
jgi:hypothetical protein